MIRDDGTLIPLGKPIDGNIGQSALLYNEFIVYDTRQIRVRYMLKLVSCRYDCRYRCRCTDLYIEIPLQVTNQYNKTFIRLVHVHHLSTSTQQLHCTSLYNSVHNKRRKYNFNKLFIRVYHEFETACCSSLLSLSYSELCILGSRS